jgi:hypothetical protein
MNPAGCTSYAEPRTHVRHCKDQSSTCYTRPDDNSLATWSRRSLESCAINIHSDLAIIESGDAAHCLVNRLPVKIFDVQPQTSSVIVDFVRLHQGPRRKQDTSR